MRKIWDIHGGVHPPENKIQSVQMPIASIELAKEITLPLNQHIGAPAEPIVTVGQRVLCGEIVAKAQGFVSAPVHASTSGIVVAIEDRLIPHSSGMSAPCIVIEADGKDEWITLQECNDIDTLSHDELIDKVRNAGIAGLGGAGFPSAVKLNPREKINTLILNGTECEPYITADDMLMREQANEVIAGAQLIAKIIGDPAEILIGVEDNKAVAIEALREAAKNTPVEIVVFPTKYPSGGEKQLIQILTGKEVANGTIPAEIGIVVQNVGTAVAIWQAVRYGKPLVERITTVVGESLNTQRNIRVRIGTPIKHILSVHGFNEHECARLIIGGPMMGYAVNDANIPLIKTTNCILVPSTKEMPEAPETQPCIRCGHCAEACPASLLPQQLYWYAQAHDHEKLEAHNLFDCIECGACSFVCPSAIPLVQYYRASKSEIKKHQADKEKSDRARLRFEHRKLRIEKIEAEKEQKRAARKLAAEQARKKTSTETARIQATSKPSSNPTNANTQSTLTPQSNDALINNSLANNSLTAEREKLEKTIASLENRISVSEVQITKAKTEDDQEKIERLSGKLEQSKNKLADMRAQLNSLPTTEAMPSQTRATNTDDPVAAAIARAQANRASPEAEKAKLERTQNSLVNRINVMKEQIAAAVAERDTTKSEKLNAKLKQSEIKLQETNDKLDALQSTATVKPTVTQASATSTETTDTKTKIESTINSLNKRIEVMEEQLITARASNDYEKENKLAAKLARSKEKLKDFENQLIEL